MASSCDIDSMKTLPPALLADQRQVGIGYRFFSPLSIEFDFFSSDAQGVNGKNLHHSGGSRTSQKRNTRVSIMEHGVQNRTLGRGPFYIGTSAVS